MTKLSIVIPAWNEENTLENLINKLLAVKFSNEIELEIILNNDGSKDKTWEIMQELQTKHKEIKAYSNERNMGKSQTVRNGILKSTGDLVIIQDADLEYDPNEIVTLVDLMKNSNLDVVYGNRFGKENKVIYYKNYYGNKVVSFFSNLFTYPRIKTWIPDMEVCYKLIRGDIARDIARDITATSRFGLEPEITAKLAKYKVKGKHLRFGILPINYYPRSVAEGKKLNAIEDGMKAVWEIIKYNL